MPACNAYLVIVCAGIFLRNYFRALDTVLSHGSTAMHESFTTTCLWDVGVLLDIFFARQPGPDQHILHTRALLTPSLTETKFWTSHSAEATACRANRLRVPGPTLLWDDGPRALFFDHAPQQAAKGSAAPLRASQQLLGK